MRHLCGLHAISIGEKVGKREGKREREEDRLQKSMEDDYAASSGVRADYDRF